MVEMTSSREQILDRLREVQPLLGAIEMAGEHLPVTPLDDVTPQGLHVRFVEQASSLDSVVHQPASQEDAIQVVLGIIGEGRSILRWDFDHIPLPGLEEAFAARGFRTVEGRDESVRIGFTGADAALAATGSLVLLSGEGKPRLASLLPPVHIAVIHQSQILADLETWVATMRQMGLDSFKETASAMIISGPSRTADIAMQLTLGMHGPRELHIVIVKEEKK